MFLLPNGAQIDDEGVLGALNDASPERSYYLDILTGQVGFVMRGKKEPGQRIAKNRYFEIPKVSPEKKIEWAKSYIQEMMAPEDELSARFLKALDEKGGRFDRFLGILKNTNEKYGWPQWEIDSLCEVRDDWFETLPVDIEDRWEFDDDCAACRAEKFNQKYGRYPEPPELMTGVED